MSAEGRLSADDAGSIAKRACRHDCLWYHGFWPHLRQLGLGTAPEDHASFYTAGLDERSVAGGSTRVLVCGTADSAMPCLAYRTLSDLGCQAELVVLDRCVTPLVITREEFALKGAAVTTVHGDALEAQFDQPFDVIVTHSILGYFSESEREALFRRWSDWLRPEGRVLTVNRLRSSATEYVRFTHEEAEAFVGRVLKAIRRTPDVTQLPVEKVRALAWQYAEQFRIRPLTSLDKLAQQAQAAGLTLETVPLGKVAHPGPSGPSVPGNAEYYGLVFHR